MSDSPALKVPIMGPPQPCTQYVHKDIHVRVLAAAANPGALVAAHINHLRDVLSSQGYLPIETVIFPVISFPSRLDRADYRWTEWSEDEMREMGPYINRIRFMVLGL